MNLDVLVGTVAWGWRVVHGSILTVEFGPPGLNIRQPIKSQSEDAKIARAMGRRKVTPVGQWSLAFETTRWRMESTYSSMMGDTYSSQNAHDLEVLADLDGQILKQIQHDPGQLTLSFDLGGVLAINGESGEAMCEMSEQGQHVASIV